MRNLTAQENKTLPMAIAFILFVCAIVFISVVVRIIILISHSTFDSSHQFILFVTQDKTKTGTFVIFTPEKQTVSLIQFTHMPSVASLQTFQDIPIDVHIKTNDNISSLNAVNTLIQQKIFNAGSVSVLQWVDALKIWWYMRKIASEDVSIQTMTYTNGEQNLQKVAPLFIDKTLYGESKTIAIINASGVIGKGSELSKILSSIGANVISVTSTKELPESTITDVGSSSYTTKRLQHILQYKLIELPSKPSIADITIVIGKDSGTFDIF